MIAFEVSLNGKRQCLAGVGETGILTAQLNWVERSEEQIRGVPDEMRANLAEKTLDLHVGGNSLQGQYHTWLSIPIQKGDKIEVVVKDAAEVDSPQTSQFLPLSPHTAA